MTSLRWVVVDDVDPAINYTGPWFKSPDQGSPDANSVGKRFGPAYRNSLHGTEKNASLSFAFNGSFSYFVILFRDS
jgi:hypothetical protein